ncbi:MAG: hypothetical protein IPO95_03295 [Rhodanobacteraceae bacterium]|nr:hypothetical protein [Rhodanobacteraceae bacterium]MBL0041259.1 hypothetical protein [Xanthomonadales bacterium]MBP7622868.1 hypothetical protein [Xanthomonadales bacterium]
MSRSSTLRRCLMLAAMAMLLIAQSLAFALPMTRADAGIAHATTAMPAHAATPPCHRQAKPAAAAPTMPCCDEEGSALRCCDGACTCVGLMLATLSVPMQFAALASPELRLNRGEVHAPLPARIPPLPPPIPA